MKCVKSFMGMRDMKIEKAIFKNMIAESARGVASSGICANVQITNGEKLRFYTSKVDYAVVCEDFAKETGDEFEVLVNYASLRSVVDGFEREIDISVNGAYLDLKEGKYIRRLKIVPDHNLPPLFTPSKVHEIDFKPFKDLFVGLKNVISPSRPILCGVHLSCVKGVVLIRASNGYAGITSQGTFDGLEDIDVILPIPAVEFILNADEGKLRLGVVSSDTHNEIFSIMFTCGHTTFHSKLIVGTYPDFGKIMPSKFVRAYDVERSIIMDTLVKFKDFDSITMESGLAEIIISADSQLASAEDAMPVSHDKAQMKAIFGTTMMTAILGCFQKDSTLAVELSESWNAKGDGELRVPLFFKSENKTAFIAPQHVDFKKKN